jgi:hypothetical protein
MSEAEDQAEPLDLAPEEAVPALSEVQKSSLRVAAAEAGFEIVEKEIEEPEGPRGCFKHLVFLDEISFSEGAALRRAAHSAGPPGIVLIGESDLDGPSRDFIDEVSHGVREGVRDRPGAASWGRGGGILSAMAAAMAVDVSVREAIELPSLPRLRKGFVQHKFPPERLNTAKPKQGVREAVRRQAAAARTEAKRARRARRLGEG